MEKKIEVSMLFGIYGKLLTKKQIDILTDYCNNDLSLSEIAENHEMTRQAVNDIVKKGEKRLFEYEKKLEIMRKMIDTDKRIQTILSEISKIKDNSSDKKIEKILNNVQKELTVLM